MFPPHFRSTVALAFATGATFLLAGCAETSSNSSRTAETSGFGTRSVAETGPGLGTGWGEERDSATRATSFVRSSGGQPHVTDRLYYNDRAGVEALLRSTPGRVENIGAMAPVPGGYESWGLRGSGVGRSYRINGDRVVVGEHGGRYEVVVRNDSGRRMEAVLSVDGLDVMTGRAASWKNRGYIIAPHTTVRVDGFRTSGDSVAAFRFSSVASSYASLKHGDTRNVGVIGLALFTERQSAPAGGWAEPPPGYPGATYDNERRRHADPFPAR